MGGGTHLVGRGQRSAGRTVAEGSRGDAQDLGAIPFKLGFGSDAPFRRDVRRVHCRQLLIG